jgi:SAM-dependent methyltransferase
MSQETGGIYSLTRIPAFYALFQDLLAGTAARRRLVSEFIQPRKGERVIELGCGAGSILRFLGDVSYLGIDENPAQIARARRLNRGLGAFAAGDFKQAAEQHSGTFDLVLCLGFLHHLDDNRADEVLSLAHDLLAPGGRMVAIDPAFTPDQARIARWLASMDSGRAVRTPGAYRMLAERRFPRIEVRVIHDLLRVPYTHNIMIASL